MSEIISKHDAKYLLEQLAEENPGNLNDLDNFFLHSDFSRDIAKETTDITASNYDEVAKRINPNEIVIAAYLHDTGRLLEKNQIFHEIRGAEYIEEYGLEKGISSSKEKLYKIAQAIRSHFIVFEQFMLPELKIYKSNFSNIDPDLLIPHTWNEAILVYCELSNVRGKRMTFKERISELKDRYSKDNLLIKALNLGEERLLRTCQRVENLRNRNLDKYEILRYGFL